MMYTMYLFMEKSQALESGLQKSQALGSGVSLPKSDVRRQPFQSKYHFCTLWLRTLVRAKIISQLDGLCMFCLMFDMFYSSLSKCMRTPLPSFDGSLSVRVDYIVMYQNYILHLALLCCILVVCICHLCEGTVPPYFTIAVCRTRIAACKTGEFFMLHLLCNTIQAVS